MLNRIQSREILAWMTLAISFLLLSVSFAYAQTKTINVDNDNGKVHIKISRTENGVTKMLDTTFSSNDSDNIDKIIEDFGESNGENIRFNSNIKHSYDNDSDSKPKKSKKIKIDVDTDMSEADMKELQENLNESMKGLKENLKEMQKSLKEMHIHINDDDNSDFNFDFTMPEIYEGTGKSYSYSYSFPNDELDDLKDEDHIVVIGDKDEKAPELEKVVTTKDGKKAFVYKRSNSEKKNESGLKSVKNIKYFPNPTHDKFTLSFHVNDKSDITIEVVDAKDRSVYSEKLNGFEGDYSKEISLSGKSKGSYFLKIAQGTRTESRKIVLE